MTGIAASTAGHSTMIEGCRYESTGGMTNTTILVGHNMIGSFTGGEGSVMAGLTIIHNTNMIKRSRYKARC